MDILAISKDRSRLLVIELKRGRASDAVVGQIQRYMGFVHEALLSVEFHLEEYQERNRWRVRQGTFTSTEPSPAFKLQRYDNP
jgi:RecB family endonuclease NucS